MRRSRFSEEQITRMIREHEAGVRAADICRKHGISDAKRLKSLQEENSKLKRLLADAMLDNAALKDLATKNL